jgi:hypothetical protein
MDVVDNLKIGGAEASYVLVLVIIILLVFAFSDQLIYFMKAAKTSLLAMIGGTKPLPCGCSGNCGCSLPDESDGQEHLDNPGKAGDVRNDVGSSDIATALGYEEAADMAWDERIKVTDLDPSVFMNHQGYVADVRRFSSGANFTSVADDNTDPSATNFVGLRRPQHVHIGPDARQQPSVDQSVLQRNKAFIF